MLKVQCAALFTKSVHSSKLIRLLPCTLCDFVCVSLPLLNSLKALAALMMLLFYAVKYTSAYYDFYFLEDSKSLLVNHARWGQGLLLHDQLLALVGTGPRCIRPAVSN